MRWTANQVVAFNLRRARDLRGWTQIEACDRLAAFVDEPWSPAVYSMAERSEAGKRVRRFDADELVALARAFELPVAWFFIPPDHAVPTHRAIKSGSLKLAPDDASAAPTLAELLADDQDLIGAALRVMALTGEVDVPLPKRETRKLATQVARQAEALARSARSLADEDDHRSMEKD